MPQHSSEPLFWFLNEAPAAPEQRVGTTPDLEFVDLSLQNAGVYLVDSGHNLMWDALGKNIYPTANRDKDLLIKLPLATYLADMASGVFVRFYETMSDSYGLQTQAGTSVEVTEVWLNAAKEIDCILVNVGGTIYYYDAAGNVINGGTPDMQLCAYVEASKYHELSGIVEGYSAYMTDVFDGTSLLKPQLALSGNTATVAGVYIAPSLNIMYYAGNIPPGNTPYKWDAAGTEITTMALDLRLAQQIAAGDYS